MAPSTMNLHLWLGRFLVVSEERRGGGTPGSSATPGSSTAPSVLARRAPILEAPRPHCPGPLPH